MPTRKGIQRKYQKGLSCVSGSIIIVRAAATAPLAPPPAWPPLQAERIYVCRSGSAADTQNLSRYVQARGWGGQVLVLLEPGSGAVLRSLHDRCCVSRFASQSHSPVSTCVLIHTCACP